MRPFYLFKSKHGIFYVQYSNEMTHARCSAKSTRERSYTAAMKVACDWMRNGIPSRTGNRIVESEMVVDTFLNLLNGGKLDDAGIQTVVKALSEKGYTAPAGLIEPAVAVPAPEPLPPPPPKTPLISFLDTFWNYESSPYIKDKLIHKQRIGKRHCYDSRNRVSYWKAYFTEAKYLEDVTTQDLKAFEQALAARGLSAGSLNHIMIVGKTAFKWAVANKKLAEDPCAGLTRYAKDTKARDILSDDEASALFRVKWLDERARVASLVAMTCGLRMGEVLALRKCDIAENRLMVRHSWSVFDGLKSPKNGKTRVVPLLPAVRRELIKLANSNPFGLDPERFIFYGNLSDRPVVENVILDGFKDALAKIRISEALRKERNIVFHSWRHYYAKVIADRVEQRQAQLALGHMTAAMTTYYADHKTESDLAAIEHAAADAFGSCLSGAV